MAILKVTNSKASINKAINYVTQEEKTEKKLVSGINCTPESVVDEMKATKEQFRKTDGRQYAHYIHSFKPGEDITHDKAHKLALELAEKEFKSYEVLVATHKDKDHIHSHILVNSVSFEDGKKLHSSKKDLERAKELSNKICEREGLSPTKPDKKTLTSYDNKKYKALEKGFKEDYKSYMLELWRNVKSSVKKATNKEQFLENMKKKGYGVNWSDTRKHITFITPEGKKVRDNNLAKTFKNENLTKEGLLNEFTRNREELRVGRDAQRVHGETQEDIRETRNGLDREGKENNVFREENREIDTGSRGNRDKKQVKEFPKIEDDDFMKEYLEKQRRKSLAKKREMERMKQPRKRNEIER